MQQPIHGMSLEAMASCSDGTGEMDTPLHAQVKPRLKRRKNHQADLNNPSAAALILLDMANLRPHFTLPLGQAAKKIGVCKTALKKACRKIGIVSWPYRKLRAVERRIAALSAKRRNEESKGSSTGKAAKPNDEVVEKLLQLKRQLLEGKDCGKGCSSLGVEDDGDFSDWDVGVEGSIGMDTFDEVMEAEETVHSSVTGCETDPAHIDKAATLPTLFDESILSISCSNTCCFGNTRTEEHHNEALNDILRSGGNPFASEFLSLSDGFAGSSSSSGQCSGWCSQSASQISPDPLQSKYSHKMSFSGDFQRAGPIEMLPSRDSESTGTTWTVGDELKSLQSLVRVLLKEQEELTNELKLSQQSLVMESQRTSILEQTVSDLRKQLAGHAHQVAGW